MIDIQDAVALANELHARFERLHHRWTFLASKEEEAKLGCKFAYPCWLASLEACENDRLLLDDHAFALTRMMKEAKLKPSPPLATLLARIHAPLGMTIQ